MPCRGCKGTDIGGREDPNCMYPPPSSMQSSPGSCLLLAAVADSACMQPGPLVMLTIAATAGAQVDTIVARNRPNRSRTSGRKPTLFCSPALFHDALLLLRCPSRRSTRVCRAHRVRPPWSPARTPMWRSDVSSGLCASIRFESWLGALFSTSPPARLIIVQAMAVGSC